jgi:hypothetical protein
MKIYMPFITLHEVNTDNINMDIKVLKFQLKTI